MNNTVERAIHTSIRENRIVHLSREAIANEAEAVRVDLLAACDDWTEGNDEIEFWGSDDDGDEWRVHVQAR